MKQIILDTNVISELMKTNPDEPVMDWFLKFTGNIFYITAITQAEIQLGIALLPNGKRREALYQAADLMFSQDFANKCLPFDAKAAANYASIVSERRRSGQTTSTEDAMIASIALSYNYPLATRNTKDFLYISDLILYNPWQPA